MISMINLGTQYFLKMFLNIFLTGFEFYPIALQHKTKKIKKQNTYLPIRYTYLLIGYIAPVEHYEEGLVEFLEP